VDALEARRACNVGSLKLEIRGGGGATGAVHVRTNDLTYDTAVEKEFSTLINSFHKDTGTFIIEDNTAKSNIHIFMHLTTHEHNSNSKFKSILTIFSEISMQAKYF
jgi:hypothetical protein